VINRKVFFDEIRQTVFGGFLEQTQVDGVNACLDYAEGHRLDPRFTCYGLATARHETGGKMQPVRENLNYTTTAQIRKTWPNRFYTDADARPYVKQPKKLAIKVYGGRLGNDPAPSTDGWDYRGDGLPQLTGKANFEKFGVEPGMDLATSVEVMYRGMTLGLFTGRKLSEFFNATVSNAIGARVIINPDKNGVLVARYHEAFLAAYHKAESAFVEDGFASTAKVADDVPVAKSPEALTIGLGTVGGAGSAAAGLATAAVSGISNQWALIAFVVCLIAFMIAAGVGLKLWLSGRLTIAKPATS